MENSKQRLYQKSLWQAANLLSQPPRVYTTCPSPPELPCPLTSFVARLLEQDPRCSSELLHYKLGD